MNREIEDEDPAACHARKMTARGGAVVWAGCLLWLGVVLGLVGVFSVA